MSKKKEEYHCKDCGIKILFCDTLPVVYDGCCVSCYIKREKKEYETNRNRI